MAGEVRQHDRIRGADGVISLRRKLLPQKAGRRVGSGHHHAQGCHRKKFLKPTNRKDAVRFVQDQYGFLIYGPVERSLSKDVPSDEQSFTGNRVLAVL